MKPQDVINKAFIESIERIISDENSGLGKEVADDIELVDAWSENMKSYLTHRIHEFNKSSEIISNKKDLVSCTSDQGQEMLDKYVKESISIVALGSWIKTMHEEIEKKGIMSNRMIQIYDLFEKRIEQIHSQCTDQKHEKRVHGQS